MTNRATNKQTNKKREQKSNKSNKYGPTLYTIKFV